MDRMDKGIEQGLRQLFDYDRGDVERLEAKIAGTQNAAPQMLEKLSQLSGMEQKKAFTANRVYIFYSWYEMV